MMQGWHDDFAASLRNTMLRRRTGFTVEQIRMLSAQEDITDLTSFLEFYQEYFYFDQDGTIYPWSKLKICKYYNAGGCFVEKCNYVHVCKPFFVRDDCPYFNECAHSHDITSSVELFRIHKLDNLSLDEIRCLFQLMEQKMADYHKTVECCANDCLEDPVDSNNLTYRAGVLRKRLLDNGGVSNFHDLCQLALSSKLNVGLMAEFLKKNKEYFKIDGDGNILAWTSLRICKHHLFDFDGCQSRGCLCLHVCKNFLVHDTCYNDVDNCRFGHRLLEIRLLEKHNLSDLSLQLIRLLFQLVYQTLDQPAANLPCKEEIDERLRKELLASGGKSTLMHFKGFMQKVGVTENDPEKYLDEHRGHFRIQKERTCDDEVIGWTTLQICRRYVEKNCEDENCRGLHVCKEHLIGSCTAACPLCHNVFEKGHNNDLLTQHHLNTLTLPELRQLYKIVFGHLEQEEEIAAVAVAEQLALVKNVRRQIVESGGILLESQVKETIKELGGDVQNITQFVRKYDKYIRFMKRDPSGSKDANSVRSIIAWTELQVCKAYMAQEDTCKSENCGRLHVCRFLLYFGNCKFEQNCVYTHEIGAQCEHNYQLLSKYELIDFSWTMLRTLFKGIKDSWFVEKNTTSSSAASGDLKKANELRKLLLEQEESVSSSSLESCALELGLEHKGVKRLVNKHREYFSIDKAGNAMPWTKLKLCKNYGYKDDGCTLKKCHALHLCHHFLKPSGCHHDSKPSECSKSHRLEKGSNNHRLLQVHNLDNLPLTSLRKLFQITGSKHEETTQTQASKWVKVREKILECGGSVTESRYKQLCKENALKSSDSRQGYISVDTENNKVAWTSLRVCRPYTHRKNGCDAKNCSNLHICWYLMMSECRNESCKFSHDVTEGSENYSSLRRYDLHELPFALLKTLYQVMQRTRTARASQKFANQDVKLVELRNLLLEEGGKVPKEKLPECAEKLNMTCKELKEFIEARRKYFHMSQEDFVMVCVPLRVCMEKDCKMSTCCRLHVCRDFFAGNCKFEETKNCRYSHEFQEDPRDVELIKRHNLQDLSLASLKLLFKMSHSLAPKKLVKSAVVREPEASSSETAVAIRRKILETEGKIPISAFQTMLENSSDVQEQPLEFIESNKDYFRLDTGGIVTAWTKLRICDAFLYSETGCKGKKCGNLHVCKHWLVHDDCRDGAGTCRFGHILSDSKNQELLKYRHLEDLPVPLIRLLFQVKAKLSGASFSQIIEIEKMSENVKHITVPLDLVKASGGSRMVHNEFIGKEGCNLLYIESVTGTGLTLADSNPENPPGQITVVYDMKCTTASREARKLILELVDKVNEGTVRHNERVRAKKRVQENAEQDSSSETSEPSDIEFMRSLLLNETALVTFGCKPELYCALCFFHLPNSKAYEIHLKGRLHGAKLKEYGNAEGFLGSVGRKPSTEQKAVDLRSARCDNPKWQRQRSSESRGKSPSDVGSLRSPSEAKLHLMKQSSLDAKRAICSPMQSPPEDSETRQIKGSNMEPMLRQKIGIDGSVLQRRSSSCSSSPQLQPQVLAYPSTSSELDHQNRALQEINQSLTVVNTCILLCQNLAESRKKEGVTGGTVAGTAATEIVKEKSSKCVDSSITKSSESHKLKLSGSSGKIKERDNQTTLKSSTKQRETDKKPLLKSASMKHKSSPEYRKTQHSKPTKSIGQSKEGSLKFVKSSKPQDQKEKVYPKSSDGESRSSQDKKDQKKKCHTQQPSSLESTGQAKEGREKIVKSSTEPLDEGEKVCSKSADEETRSSLDKKEKCQQMPKFNQIQQQSSSESSRKPPGCVEKVKECSEKTAKPLTEPRDKEEKVCPKSSEVKIIPAVSADEETRSSLDKKEKCQQMPKFNQTQQPSSSESYRKPPECVGKAKVCSEKTAKPLTEPLDNEEKVCPKAAEVKIIPMLKETLTKQPSSSVSSGKSKNSNMTVKSSGKNMGKNQDSLPEFTKNSDTELPEVILISKEEKKNELSDSLNDPPESKKEEQDTEPKSSTSSVCLPEGPDAHEKEGNSKNSKVLCNQIANTLISKSSGKQSSCEDQKKGDANDSSVNSVMGFTGTTTGSQSCVDSAGQASDEVPSQKQTEVEEVLILSSCDACKDDAGEACLDNSDISDSEWFAAIVSPQSGKTTEKNSEEHKEVNKKSPRKKNTIWNVLPDGENDTEEIPFGLQREGVSQVSLKKRKEKHRHGSKSDRQKSRHGSKHRRGHHGKHGMQGKSAEKLACDERNRDRTNQSTVEEKECTKHHSRKRKRSKDDSTKAKKLIVEDSKQIILLNEVSVTKEIHEDPDTKDDDDLSTSLDIQNQTNKTLETLFLSMNRSFHHETSFASNADVKSDEGIHDEAIDGLEVETERQVAQSRRRSVYDVLIRAQDTWDDAAMVAKGSGEESFEEVEIQSNGKPAKIRKKKNSKMRRLKEKLRKWKKSSKGVTESAACKDPPRSLNKTEERLIQIAGMDETRTFIEYVTNKGPKKLQKLMHKKMVKLKKKYLKYRGNSEIIDRSPSGGASSLTADLMLPVGQTDISGYADVDALYGGEKGVSYVDDSRKGFCNQNIANLDYFGDLDPVANQESLEPCEFGHHPNVGFSETGMSRKSLMDPMEGTSESSKWVIASPKKEALSPNKAKWRGCPSEKAIHQDTSESHFPEQDPSICRSYADLRKKLDMKKRAEIFDNNLKVDIPFESEGSKVAVKESGCPEVVKKSGNQNEIHEDKDHKVLKSVEVSGEKDEDVTATASMKDMRTRAKFLKKELRALEKSMHRMESKQTKKKKTRKEIITRKLYDIEEKLQAREEKKREDKENSSKNKRNPLVHAAASVRKKYDCFREASVMRDLGKQRETVMSASQKKTPGREPSRRESRVRGKECDGVESSTARKVQHKSARVRDTTLKKTPEGTSTMHSPGERTKRAKTRVTTNEVSVYNPITGIWELGRESNSPERSCESLSIYGSETSVDSYGHRRDRSPMRQRSHDSRSSKSPYSHGRSPYRSRSKSPHYRHRRSRSPYYGRSRSPDHSRSNSPSYRHRQYRPVYRSRSRSRNRYPRRRSRSRSPLDSLKSSKRRRQRAPDSAEKRSDKGSQSPMRIVVQPVVADDSNAMDPDLTETDVVLKAQPDAGEKVTPQKKGIPKNGGNSFKSKKKLVKAPVQEEEPVPDLEESSENNMETSPSKLTKKTGSEVLARLVELFGDIFALQIQEQNFLGMEHTIEKNNKILVASYLRKRISYEKEEQYLEAAAQDFIALSGQLLNFVCTCAVWKMLKMGPVKYKEDYFMVPTPRPSNVHKALEAMMINVQMQDTLALLFDKFLRTAKQADSMKQAASMPVIKVPPCATSHSTQSRANAAPGASSAPTGTNYSMSYPPSNWPRYPMWPQYPQPYGYPYYPGTIPAYHPPPQPLHQPPPPGN